MVSGQPQHYGVNILHSERCISFLFLDLCTAAISFENRLQAVTKCAILVQPPHEINLICCKPKMAIASSNLSLLFVLSSKCFITGLNDSYATTTSGTDIFKLSCISSPNLSHGQHNEGQRSQSQNNGTATGRLFCL